jgi:hypothetical protein
MGAKSRQTDAVFFADGDDGIILVAGIYFVVYFYIHIL